MVKVQSNIKDLVPELNKKFSDAPAEDIVGYFLQAFKGRIALSSSLSIEDQTLTDIIVKIDKSARIFTLDTGRLFPETYQLIDKTNMTYGINLEVFFPNYEAVQQMVKEEGINLFYNSIESRHRCCQVRKLEPLKRAMQGLDVWICGLRKQQSVTRKDMQVVEWDDIHNLIKVNPLINWSEEDVEQYVKNTMCLITSYRTRAIRASVANLVQGPSSQAKISEPEDGGGNRRNIANADCIREARI